jgi:hypothetical protein
VLQEFTAQVPPALCSAARGGTCALDVVGKNQAQDMTVIKRGQETVLIGWAADTDTGTVPPVVIMQLAPPSPSKPEDKKAPASKVIEYKKGEKVYFAGATRITKRTDVAEVQKTPAFIDSGYDLLASFKKVPAGEYTVGIAQVTANGQALVCDTTRRLKIE